MSIITVSNYNNENKTTVEYTGRVVSTFLRCDRVMSDIYADVLYARVIKDDGSEMSVQCKAYFECDPRDVRVTVDVTPEWIQLYNAKNTVNAAQDAVAALDRCASRDSEKAVARLLEPKRGEKIIVTRKGKAVKNGETGTCFWVGNSKYDNSVRVGFVSDEDGSKKYIGLGSCRHIDAVGTVLIAARKAVLDSFKDDKDKAVTAYEAAVERYNEQKVITHWIALGHVENPAQRTELTQIGYAGT